MRSIRTVVSALIVLGASLFSQQSSNIFQAIPNTADTSTGEVRFLEKRSNGTNYFSFKAPTSMSGNILVTPFLSLPASTECVTLSASGQLSTSGCGLTYTPTRTSDTVLTLPAIAADQLGVASYNCGAISAGATFTVSSGTGTLWIALANDCTVVVRHNVTGTCSAGCTAVSGASGFDPADLPLHQWTVTTAVLAANGTAKLTAYRSQGIAAGSGVSFSTSSGVTTISASPAFNPIDTTASYLRDEFPPGTSYDGTTSIVGQLRWVRSTNPTVAPNVTNLDANHPGIIRVTNQAASASSIDLAQGQAFSSSLSAYSGWEARYIFRPNSATVVHRIGFWNAFATNPTDYVGLYYDSASHTNWQAVMRAASGSTLTSDTGVAYSTSNWFTLRIRSEVTGTIRISIATNGGAFSTEKTVCASGCDISGTMPTTNMSPFFYIYTAAGTANMDIDFFGWKSTVTR
jgi:hypothetical protein